MVWEETGSQQNPIRTIHQLTFPQLWLPFMRIANKLMLFIGGGAVVTVLATMIFVSTEINSLLTQVDDYHRKILELSQVNKLSSRILMETESEFKRTIDGEINSLLVSVLSITFGSLFLFFLFLIYISKRIVAPLNEAVRFSDDLSKGDFSRELKSDAKDEIGALIKSLNHMRSRLEYSISKLKSSHGREKLARQEAESANSVKSDFIANVARELRNPLNSITGISTLLLKEIERGAYDQDLGRKVQTILSSSEILNDLINSLLELSRLGSEEIELNITDFDTTVFVRELINANLFSAEKRNVSIENHFSSSMPAMLSTDQEMVFQILNKIISNALRVAPIEGRLIVGSEKRGSDIIFWIEDAHAGAGAISLAEAFNKHVEMDLNVNVPTGFKGMILLNFSIAKANAQLLGARLSAQTTPSGNSLFSLTFKENIVTKQSGGKLANTRTATNLQVDSSQLKAETERFKRPVSQDQVCVLMAEDNEANRMLVELIFQNTDYDLECVDDGVTCLDVLNRRKFNLLLLDLQMPRLDGYDVLRRIRSNNRFDDMPIIVMTAYLEKGDQEKLLEMGANDCILKPIDVDEVLNKIRSLL